MRPGCRTRRTPRELSRARGAVARAVALYSACDPADPPTIVVLAIRAGLAFVAALHSVASGSGGVLLLRDVLQWTGRRVADLDRRHTVRRHRLLQRSR